MRSVCGGHRSGPVPVLGVPGYPVSAIIVLEELMRPVLGLYTGIVPGGEARQAEAPAAMGAAWAI